MKSERGQAAFEWTIMLAVVLAISVTAIHFIAAQTSTVWAGVASKIQ